jgi:DNA polymerase III delta prime subunit
MTHSMQAARCSDQVKNRHHLLQVSPYKPDEYSQLIETREKMNIPANVLEQLITGAQSDIRQILNMLSTWKLSKGDMTFDESKQLYSNLRTSGPQTQSTFQGGRQPKVYDYDPF